MKKWADFLISKVRYDKNHLILMAKRHEDNENGISTADLVDRMKISSDIANGFSYITIYNQMSTWKKGNKINFFRINGQPYLRIDKNRVNQDYLGDITEIPTPVIPEPEEATPEQIAKLEQLEKQIAELESKPKKEEPELLQNYRGSLPMETTEELPQELDLVPESVSEPEEATPEQIAKLEQLEKQIAELESKPKKEEPELLQNYRGSLPMETTEELPQELDLVPESVSEPEEATPEQIAKLEQLEKQIAELELKPKKVKPEEATPEQIAKLEQLEKQIAELELKKKLPK